MASFDDADTPEAAPSATSAFLAAASVGGHAIGRFLVTSEAGKGGGGVVYKAYDPKLHRHVAVKVPRPETNLDRFGQEGLAMARLNHRHVVPVLEVEVDSEPIHIVMELMPGGSLAQRLKDTGPMPSREAATLCRKLAEALAHSHVAGVLHRDVKPQNVLFDVDGEPRLSDFGLAKLSGEDLHTASGLAPGTLGYMAPEQLQGRQADARSDLYGLGATLYACLAGESPFSGDSIVLDTLQREPPPLQGVDRPLVAVCLKCLEKDRDQRYADAEEVVADLGRYLEDQPVQARIRSRSSRAWLWGRRHPWSVALVILAAGGLAVLRQGPSSPVPNAGAVAPIESRRAREAWQRGERAVEAHGRARGLDDLCQAARLSPAEYLDPLREKVYRWTTPEEKFLGMAIERLPEFPILRVDRAAYSLRLDQFEAVLIDLDAVEGRFSDPIPLIHLLRGNALGRQGRTDEARLSYRSVLRACEVTDAPRARRAAEFFLATAIVEKIEFEGLRDLDADLPWAVHVLRPVLDDLAEDPSLDYTEADSPCPLGIRLSPASVDSLRTRLELGSVMVAGLEELGVTELSQTLGLWDIRWEGRALVLWGIDRVAYLRDGPIWAEGITFDMDLDPHVAGLTPVLLGPAPLGWQVTDSTPRGTYLTPRVVRFDLSQLPPGVLLAKPAFVDAGGRVEAWACLETAVPLVDSLELQDGTVHVLRLQLE